MPHLLRVSPCAIFLSICHTSRCHHTLLAGFKFAEPYLLLRHVATSQVLPSMSTLSSSHLLIRHHLGHVVAQLRGETFSLLFDRVHFLRKVVHLSTEPFDKVRGPVHLIECE